MAMSKDKIYASIFILLGIAIIIHQLIFYAKIWEWNDALHHEWFSAILIMFGLGILVGKKIKG